MKSMPLVVLLAAALPLLLPPGSQTFTQRSTQDADDPLLAGPPSSDPGLVRYDFNGSLLVVPGRPEEAAVALLDDVSLGEKTRQAAGDRLLEIAYLLIDNIDVVRVATDAIRAGDNARAQQLSRELYDRFEPQHPRDPLLARLENDLTAEQHAEVKKSLDAYWDAWIEWELRNSPEKSNELRRTAQEALAFRLFQTELRDAYRIALQPVAQRLERIYIAIEPTDEQREVIRSIMIDYVRAARLSVSEEAQRETSRRIYDVLDDDQRRRALEVLIWRL